MPETGRLIVNGEGGVEVEHVVEFLSDLRNAYNSILAFDIITSQLSDWPFPYEPLTDNPVFTLRRRGRRGVQVVGDWPINGEQVATLVPLGERLVLSAVEIASPGLWEFLGSLSMLEVLRRYLADRHERRKDRAYRETAEERRLFLENLQREDALISGRLRTLRENGATERQLAPLLNGLLNRPLTALDKHQDRGLIGDAKIGPPDEPRTPEDKPTGPRRPPRAFRALRRS
jgi:hypothetical protein